VSTPPCLAPACYYMLGSNRSAEIERG
jgi:hypothetical protein